MAFILLKKKLITTSWMKFIYLTENYLAIESSYIKFNVAIKIDPELIGNFLAYLVQDKKSIQDNGVYDFYCKGQEAEASEPIKKLLANEKTFSPFHVQRIAIGMSVDREDTQKETVYPRNSQKKQKNKHGKNFEIEAIFDETGEENKSLLKQVHINFHIEYEKGKTLSESIFSLENTVNYFISAYSRAKDELIALDLENFKQRGYQVEKKSILTLMQYKEKSHCPTELDFTNYPLGVSGINSLAATLMKWKTLQKLNLKDSEIEDEGLKLLVSGLEENAGLLVLNLENNHIGIEGIKALSGFLEKNVALTHLDLSSNPLGPAGSKILFLALQKNTTLQELHLGDVQLGDQGACDLADYVRKNETLTRLSLKNNKITHVGITALGLALENKKIQILNLGGNNLSQEGVNVLMRSLQKNSSLTSLQLYGSKIDVEGAKLLANFLAINTALITLNLRSNQLGSVGSNVIALSLEKNTTLKCINLQYNQIGESLAKDVIFILQHNTSLAILDVAGNGLSCDHIKTIIPALEKNTTIRTLEILQKRKKFNPESNSPNASLKQTLGALLSRNSKFSLEKTMHPEETSINLNCESPSESKADFSLMPSSQKKVFDQAQEQSNSISQNTPKFLSNDSVLETLPLSTSTRSPFFQKKEAPQVISYTSASFSKTLMPIHYSPLFFPAEFYGDSKEEKILKELKRITAQAWKKTKDFFYCVAENKALAESICAYFKSHQVGVVLKNQKRVQIKNISLEAVLKINVIALENQSMLKKD